MNFKGKLQEELNEKEQTIDYYGQFADEDTMCAEIVDSCKQKVKSLKILIKMCNDGYFDDNGNIIRKEPVTANYADGIN